MFGKLRCWWKGKHLRGRFVRSEDGFKVYACPRGGRETRYRVKS